MIARLLQDKFIKESTVLHEKMKQKQLQIAAGWYSKAEMSDQLNWDEHRPQQKELVSRNNAHQESWVS